jgi:hypothetical protein
MVLNPPTVLGAITTGAQSVTGNITETGGSLDIATAGQGLKIAEGANAKQGISGAMVAGAATVNTTAVTASSRIQLTRQEGGVSPGAVFVTARVAGTSFTIGSTNGADTGQVAWELFEPG